jgi:hypothetical protein
MSWQSRVALRCASIICAIPPKALSRVSQSLLDADGEDQFRLLVERFYYMDRETRAAVVSRMQPARNRLVRVVKE